MEVRRPESNRVRTLFSVACLLSLALTARPAGAEMEEYRVKALFLYNFTQFIEWPIDSFRDATESLTICVVGPTPFETGELERAIAGKRIDSHPLATRVIREVKEAAGCHMVFVSAASVKKGKGVVTDSKQTGVLTVGEVPGFATSGGVINFLVKDGRVRLEINVTSAEREKLHVSAKLLKLAEIVK